MRPSVSTQPEGAVIGGLFALFVIARLIFFTLNKADSDPAYFHGVPSPAGGITTMSSLALFHERPLLVGFLVGITCTLMITFDVQHRHLGRALASRRMRAYAALFLAVLALSAALSGFSAGVALVLTTLLVYGFSPSIAAFRRVLSSRKGTESLG
jgi:phosphatidylserine synthase